MKRKTGHCPPPPANGAGAHLIGLRTSNAAGRHAGGVNRQRTRGAARRAAIRAAQD